MSDLRDAYEAAGLLSVETYVQSGNVVFRGPENESESAIVRSIESAIEEKFGLDDVRVILRSKDEFRRIIAECPFTNRDVSKLHVTFLEKKARKDIPTKELEIARRGSEEFAIEGREVYLFLPYGYGRTKLSNGFFEKKLGEVATTRNWRTAKELLRIASSSTLPRSTSDDVDIPTVE